MKAMNTLSPEARRAIEEAAAATRWHNRYGVRFTVILSADGARIRQADGTYWPRRACVAGTDRTLNYISADPDGALHCTCHREACAHLAAYADYL